jgi:hypothetical protein
MGNKAAIRAGDVQRMTAGTGVRHSEFNFADEPVHLYQIWILPGQRGLTPSYAQRTMQVSDYKNRLWAVASNDKSLANTVLLNTDATIYMSDFDAGHIHEFKNDPRRRLFLYVTSGDLDVNGISLHTSDQARLENEEKIKITAPTNSRFIVVEVP